jgi:SAM-dependent methyltransferase
MSGAMFPSMASSPLESILDKAPTIRICGKSPVGAFLRASEWTWNHVPTSFIDRRPVRACGHVVHLLVRRWASRRHYTGTYFLRNRPQLELISRLSQRRARASAVRMAVLGCSNGSEVYSILATIRSERPHLKVTMHAVDISRDVLDLARKGEYSFTSPELVGAPIFERLTHAELAKMFHRQGDTLKVQPWIKDGIRWHFGDAAAPELFNLLGPQDIVVANNFLCHMKPAQAESCLRRIARLVEPGGYLVVSGIDLDVRSHVATDLGWRPVPDLLEAIHEGDAVMRKDWPSKYWGLEPLDKGRADWMVRYAAVFQLGEQSNRGSDETA